MTRELVHEPYEWRILGSVIFFHEWNEDVGEVGTVPGSIRRQGSFDAGYFEGPAAIVGNAILGLAGEISSRWRGEARIGLSFYS